MYVKKMRGHIYSGDLYDALIKVCWIPTRRPHGKVVTIRTGLRFWT